MPACALGAAIDRSPWKAEDTYRARKDHSPQNLALVRRMSLNKDGVRRRKLRASLNDGYRFQATFGKPPT